MKSSEAKGPNLLSEGVASFTAEGRLLQELGERLVGSPAVALVELIKNAYDADAPSCTVSVAEDKLTVTDEGLGMTKAQFLNRWMRIATEHKILEPVSPLYGRKRSGQKGIGRFAVRFLGRHLRLISIADDATLKKRTRLVADFDWTALDGVADISKVSVPYSVTETAERTGVTLEITELRQSTDFLDSTAFHTEVLRIVSPLQSLRRGRFAKRSSGGEVDPGFRTVLPSSTSGGPGEDIAAELLGLAWAELTIEISVSQTRYTVRSPALAKDEHLTIRKSSRFEAYGDIRFFPRRAGVFSSSSVDGRKAWTWVRENCGVSVIDHGFRIRPYGFEDDDWLHLDIDGAYNRRNWRSSVALAEFPIPDAVANRPADNPALNLPSNHQLVGAISVESRGSSLKKENDSELIIAMDREGFVANAGFAELVDAVRGGIEFLAQIDKRNAQAVAQAKAKTAAKEVRSDFAAAVKTIQDTEGLSRSDKDRIVKHYADLAKRLDAVEEYDREARKKLETMGLLGVVAAFMTHESGRILDGLRELLDELRVAPLPRKARGLIERLDASYQSFKGQLDYTTIFVESVHTNAGGSYQAAPQVRRIVDRFGAFAAERGITVDIDVPPKTIVSGMPVAAYSGVLLNLYINALKAVVGHHELRSPPQVLFRGWTAEGRHVMEVLDKGTGVPPELERRIFDPLFTTTSTATNPLGSGMGLGLSIVRDVVGQYKGKIRLAPATHGFATCFRLEVPLVN